MRLLTRNQRPGEGLINPFSWEAEPFRMLRSGVRFSGFDTPVRTLLVCSDREGSGKSMVAANLALSFARVGERVLLVDADLRRPTQSEIFGVGERMGLTTLLVRGGDLDAVVVPEVQEGLDMLSSGPLPPNPSELLSSHWMTELVSRMAERYDIVIMDAPPILRATEASVLASMVDGVLMVVDLKRSRRRELLKAMNLLDRAGARVIGTCVNRFGRAQRGASYTLG